MKARKINIPKIRYLLGLLLALLALLVYLSDPFSTLSRSARNMSLEDPGQVNRLIISGKQDTVTLTRTAEKAWTLNGGLEASPPAVNDLLGWLERIRVQAPVPADKGGFEEYFSGSPLRLQWIAGHRKKQSLEILTIPADNRFLVQRTGQRKWYLAESFGNKLIPADFIRPSMNAWRSKVLFELDPYTIRDISLQNHTRPAASFRLAYRPGEGFLLFNQDGILFQGAAQNVPADIIPISCISGWRIILTGRAGIHSMQRCMETRSICSGWRLKITRPMRSHSIRFPGRERRTLALSIPTGLPGAARAATIVS